MLVPLVKSEQRLCAPKPSSGAHPSPMPRWYSLSSRLPSPLPRVHAAPLHLGLETKLAQLATVAKALLWVPVEEERWERQGRNLAAALSLVVSGSVVNEPPQGHRPPQQQGRTEGFEAQILGLQLECHICLSYPRFWNQQCIFLVVVGLGWGRGRLGWGGTGGGIRMGLILD